MVAMTSTVTATTTAQTGTQDGARTAAAAGAQQPKHSPLDWIQQTIKASSQDARRQPWKKHFASTVVESRIDDGPDLVVVKKSRSKPHAAVTQNGDDNDDDDCCPFQIQGSSLAA